MPLLDWSKTILGFEAHRRGPQAIIGCSHMAIREAFGRYASIGCTKGWLQSEGDFLHMGGVFSDHIVPLDITTLLAGQRQTMTEGVVGGHLVFVPQLTEEDSGPPPDCLELKNWAEQEERHWLHVCDNEQCWFAGCPDAVIDSILLWYCEGDQILSDEPNGFLEQARIRLCTGLFDHGWTRNGELVKAGRKPTVDLWAGVHARSMLEYAEHQCLSVVQHGMRLQLVDKEWRASEIEGTCPLDDETGRLAPRLT